LKRKPILLKRLLGNHAGGGKRTIGLIGVNRGAGVTYTGMLLAYYFSREKGLRTSYLECNSHLDFSLMQEAYEWNEEDEYSFSLDGITYYKQVTKSQIPDLINSNYDCCIMDFGIDFINARDEFIRCSNKIVVADRAIWNQSKTIEFFKTIVDTRGSMKWICMIPFSNQSEVMELSRIIDKSIDVIPFEPDPTSLSKETCKLFCNLFG
jgi:hypothetical protein